MINHWGVKWGYTTIYGNAINRLRRYPTEVLQLAPAKMMVGRRIFSYWD